MSTRYRINKPLKRIIITLGVVFLLGILLASVAKEERLQEKEDVSKLNNFNKGKELCRISEELFPLECFYF